MGEGREGDWECGSCCNRNYAFRSFCNRCKKPRLLVDTKTPSDSKWLPRIGDWICSGCSNNNYASRELCKKCGQPKEESAISAITMPGGPFPAYSHYFPRMQGLLGSKMNFGMAGRSAFQQSFPTGSGWGYMTFPGNSNGDISYGDSSDQLLGIPKGWRDGDWLCDCGFHNYSSRTQCKKCNEPIPTSGMNSSAANSSNLFRGTKRLASEEFANDWHKKRLIAGEINHQFLTSETHYIYPDLEQLPGPSGGHAHGLYSKYYGRNLPSQLSAMPTLLGKGAKQWRDGDWMCQKCNNHNFASRSTCNRCKTVKESGSQPVSVA
ncbi:uncharacterized RNA-binding protein C17H9.04c [Phalaenopsis equestris]|uniref:uncharacterized RNA-binding protein C17H9.04c n=1 Tax=Phalaenopsis equestris TaxID=78828 RepID=UPI0009E26B92|nr:uncharacterized RNA-binding protein C17H9.04c [Phalaenopsis equestris]